MDPNMQNQMALWTVYLPLNDNDGQPLATEQLSWARDEIARFAGGCTLLPASDGLWIGDDARTYCDRVLPIQVVALAEPESQWFFAGLAAQLALLLEQEVIFVHCTPVTVVTPLPLVTRQVEELFAAGGTKTDATFSQTLFQQ